MENKKSQPGASSTSESSDTLGGSVKNTSTPSAQTSESKSQESTKDSQGGLTKNDPGNKREKCNPSSSSTSSPSGCESPAQPPPQFKDGEGGGGDGGGTEAGACAQIEPEKSNTSTKNGRAKMAEANTNSNTETASSDEKNMAGDKLKQRSKSESANSTVKEANLAEASPRKKIHMRTRPGTMDNFPPDTSSLDVSEGKENNATSYVGAGSADPNPQYVSSSVPHTHAYRSRATANRHQRPSPAASAESSADDNGHRSTVQQNGTSRRSRSAHNGSSHRSRSNSRNNRSREQLKQQPQVRNDEQFQKQGQPTLQNSAEPQQQQPNQQLNASGVDNAIQPLPSNSQNNLYNWQASKTTVKERLDYMFNNDVMADVYFIVGKPPHSLRIPAHKFILAISSAVFDAMFYGGMATLENEIEIPDVEPSAFLALLRFVYTDDVQIGPETVMTTLYAAKKYAVPALERACVDFLKRNLCSENAFMLLTQARLFDEPQLAALCLETIDKNTNEALNAEGFTDIDLDTLCVVLERDTLGIRECKLFNAVCRWAAAETQRQNLPVTPEHQRAALGRALDCIRFPLMTVEEFAVGAAQSGILTDREVVDLFLHFTVNPKPGVKFLDTPRCCLTGKEQCVSRFCQIESRWGYSGTSDRVRFMVNRRIFVVGFGLYGSIHGTSEYGVNIQVIHTDTGKVCGQNDNSFQCDGTTSTSRVMFKEPVEIQPNTNYTACATLKGPDSYYGTKGLRKVTHESLTSGKVTFQFTYAAGNNNGTSVEDGQIPEIIFYT